MKVGIISVTINASNPITAYLKNNCKDFDLINYLDEGLIRQVRNEQLVTVDSFKRMGLIIKKAKNDGVEAILLTCTVFSPYAKVYEETIGIPVVPADEAMIEAIYEKNLRTLMLFTFESTIKTTGNLVDKLGRELHRTLDYKMELVEGAFDAIQNGDTVRHDQLIAKKIIDAAKEYDVIVLGQMSMSQVGNQVDVPVEILTSPSCAAERLKNIRASIRLTKNELL